MNWYIDTETYYDLDSYAKTLTCSEKEKEVLIKKKRKVGALDTLENHIRLLQIQRGDNAKIELLDFFIPEEKERALSYIGQFKNHTLVGHNLKFDIKSIKASYPELLDIDSLTIYDTLIAYKLYKYATTTINQPPAGLKHVVKDIIGIDLSKEMQNSDWGGELTEEQLTYARLDVEYLPAIKDFLENAGLYEPLVVLENKVSLVTAKSELRGLRFDFNYLNKFVENINKDKSYIIALKEIKNVTYYAPSKEVKKEIKAKFVEQFGNPKTGSKKRAKMNVAIATELYSTKKYLTELQTKLNVNSSDNMKSYIASKGVKMDYSITDGALSSDKPTLIRNVDADTLFKHILLVKEKDRQKTMIKDYIAKQKEGRIHANFNSIGASTGRFTSSAPNLQQIPRALKLNITTGDEDNIILKADYPAIELRIASVVMKEFIWRDLLLENPKADLHKLTASILFDIPTDKITKAQRQAAKPVNFGLIYGMGAKRLKDYAFIGFGLNWTLSEAEFYRNKFFNFYTGVKRFHMLAGEKLRNARTIRTKTMFNRYRKVETFTAYNNTSIQGTGADIFKLAILEFNNRSYHIPNCSIVNYIHDELIVECRKENRIEVEKILSDSMEFVVNKFLPFKTFVDVDIVE